MSKSGSAIGNVADTNILVEMAMGYARSRALCAAARLELADRFGDGERTIAQLALACKADETSLYRLLRALASFGVVSETAPSRFVLTPLGASLRKDAPDSVWAAVIFWADLLADQWSFLTECVQTGQSAARIMDQKQVVSRWASDPNAPAIFRAVMGTAPAENYMAIAKAWDFSKYGTVADLGGGGGGLLAALLQAFPNLRGILVDRQEAIARAQARFQSDELAGRCQLLSADLCESVPLGADVYILKHVLHGYRDEAATGILRNCHRVVPPSGRLLLLEFVLPETVRCADSQLESRLMSDLNMLVVTGGKERTEQEWRKLLKSSAFDCPAIIPVPGETVTLIEAQTS
jgi:ubiquinone/menaquinone biosynthesis C-methylase UbiE